MSYIRLVGASLSEPHIYELNVRNVYVIIIIYYYYYPFRAQNFSLLTSPTNMVQGCGGRLIASQRHLASHAHIHDLPAQMQLERLTEPERLTETVQIRLVGASLSEPHIYELNVRNVYVIIIIYCYYSPFRAQNFSLLTSPTDMVQGCSRRLIASQRHLASHAHIHDLPAQMQLERLTEPERLTGTVQLVQPTPSTVYTTLLKKKEMKA